MAPVLETVRTAMPILRLAPLLGTLLLGAGLLGADFLGVGAARADDDHDRARAALREGRILPLETIVAKAGADFPGDILDVELDEEDDGIVYEIKTITADGRILKLEYDAATGELLKVKGRGSHGSHGRHSDRR